MRAGKPKSSDSGRLFKQVLVDKREQRHRVLGGDLDELNADLARHISLATLVEVDGANDGLQFQQSLYAVENQFELNATALALPAWGLLDQH